MFVVFGANGRAGGETASALINAGKPVRVVLRRREQAPKWKERGAEIAIGSIDDVESMVTALDGATGAFLLCPPPSEGDPFTRAHDVGGAFAEAVRRAGVPKIVALSSIGAQHRQGTGIIATLNTLERQLDGVAPSVTFLRPGYFIETWEEVAPIAAASGVLPSFLEPSKEIPMVSTIDVGQAVADLLSDDFQDKRILELRGPRDYSADDVAQAFAKALDKPVQTAFVPPQARAAVLAEAGLTPLVAAALLGMYEGLANNTVTYEPGRNQRLGSVSLEQAVQRIVKGLEAHAPSSELSRAG